MVSCGELMLGEVASLAGASLTGVGIELQRLRVLWLDECPEFAFTMAHLDNRLVLEVASDPAEVYEAVSQNRYDVLLMDLSFGGSCDVGLELIRGVRRLDVPLAIVVFTAADTVPIRLDSLVHSGADDFVAKHPGCWSTEDLYARIVVATFRRRFDRWRGVAGERVCFGAVAVDLHTSGVFLGGKFLHLPRQLNRLLLTLIERRGCAVSHRELCAASGIQVDPGFHNLRTQIGRLKARLGTSGTSIRVERGRGWFVICDDATATGSNVTKNES